MLFRLTVVRVVTDCARKLCGEKRLVGGGITKQRPVIVNVVFG